MASKNSNTFIGIILIGVIMIGFMVIQSKENKRQKEYQDMIAASQPQQPEETLVTVSTEPAALSDSTSFIPQAAPVATEVYTIENDLLALTFVSQGGQPQSARVKDYTNYDGSPLYLFRDFTIAKDSTAAPVAQSYNKLDLIFDTYTLKGNIYDRKPYHMADIPFTRVDSLSSETTLVMAAPFGPGEIRQTYTMAPGSYQVGYRVDFIGLQDIVTKKVGSMQMDYSIAFPRLEKGLRNEKQYSKINYSLNNGDVEDVGGGADKSTSEGGSISWVGYQQQFFSVILRKTDKPFSNAKSIGVKYKEENDPDHRLMDCSSTLYLPFEGGQETASIDFEFYMGPNDYYGLKILGNNYEKIVPLGGWLVGWFTKWVIIPMFHFFHDNMGIVNFGLIILLMTLVIKLIVLPLAYKSYSSTAKMQALRPELDKINAKFPNQDDAMKKQQATMDLYRRAGVSPMGGCLPMLLQFPILWAMFRFFPASIELRQQPFLWCDDLSSYDNILPAGFELPIIGHLSLFALLMAVSMFFYSKLMSTAQSSGNDPTSKMMKFMSVWLMPIMMFFICNSLSAGLSYYYLLSNLITMLESWIIRKWFVDREAILAKVRASEGKPAPKTKWQLRLEEAQKMQRQREQQKNGRR